MELVVAQRSVDFSKHRALFVITQVGQQFAAKHSDPICHAFFAAFPGVHGTVDRVWLAGDTIIVRYIAIGIQEGDFMGVPASQTTVTWTGINIYQLECVKIVEQWGEADHFGRIEQQGVIPVASPTAG